MNWNRFLSAAVAACYLTFLAMVGGFPSAFRGCGNLVLPMACIWFGDELGGITGTFGLGAGVTDTTPGCAVKFGGWLVLLGLIVITIYVRLSL